MINYYIISRGEIIKYKKIGINIAIGFLLLASFNVIGEEFEDETYDNLTIDYFFEKPVINKITINEMSYDQIEMINCVEANDVGEPNTPSYGVNILLPQGTEIAGIKVNAENRFYLGDNFNIDPVLEPVILSEIHKKSNIVKNEAIYKSKNVFPDSLYEFVNVYSFRGYDILVMALFPIQYIPQTGELYYFDQMSVSVDLKQIDKVNPYFRSNEQDENQLLTKVDNPIMVKSYVNTLSRPVTLELVELLIITTEEFKNDFLPLKQAHDTSGVRTEIRTLTDICGNPSLAQQEDIRNYIRDIYKNSNLEYVLIGGDYDIIPTRDLWVEANVGGTKTNMPSDLYYACLDGCYNFDEDNRWGERNDGPDGEDVDLIAEVYIGRASVGNTDEVKNFVDKTVAYLENGKYSSGDVLMVGEYLWSDPDTWGGDYMDELVDESHSHNYKTTGLPSDVFEVDHLYDRDWEDNDWSKSEIMNKINNNVRIIHHLGHSSYGYNMKMVNDDVSSLTNNEPCFIYSQGCMAGGFDDPQNYDCIAEYLTVKTDNAAFAAIMNARYGWGVVGSTNGASQRFHRQFLDAIYGEGIQQIGKANHDSKEDNLHRIHSPCMRWCYYELNLFGDPTLSFHNDDNHAPTRPAKPSGAQFGLINNNYHFLTVSNDVDGDEIFYKWDWGDGTFSEWLGPYESNEEISIKHEWENFGFYKIRVKVRDEHMAQSMWSESISIFMPRDNQKSDLFSGRFAEQLTNLFQLIRIMKLLF